MKSGGLVIGLVTFLESSVYVMVFQESSWLNTGRHRAKHARATKANECILLILKTMETELPAKRKNKTQVSTSYHDNVLRHILCAARAHLFLLYVVSSLPVLVRFKPNKSARFPRVGVTVDCVILYSHRRGWQRFILSMLAQSYHTTFQQYLWYSVCNLYSVCIYSCEYLIYNNACTYTRVRLIYTHDQ